MKRAIWLLLMALVVALGLLATACAPAATPTPEVIVETVEVTVEVPVVETVEVPVGGELVTIVARGGAKPPTADWRCNNMLFGLAEVNADL